MDTRTKRRAGLASRERPGRRKKGPTAASRAAQSTTDPATAPKGDGNSPAYFLAAIEAMKPNTKEWALWWLYDGAPAKPEYADEHHYLTEILAPFRAAYLAASDDTRAEVWARLFL